MRISLPVSLLLSFALVLNACKKENKVPILSVTPTNVDIDVVSGNVVSFIIKGRSDNSTLSRLLITSKRGNNFTTTVIDSSISATQFTWNWEFMVAHSTQAYNDLLTFSLFDANGVSMTTQRTLYVTLGATVLTETTGHVFYSANSTTHPETAFDLETRVQVLNTTDSTQRDIQDDPPSGIGEAIGRRWISPANGRLVLANSFNYANATDVSLHDAFESSLPLQSLSNINSGDIVLVRLGSLPANTSHYVAIRVTEVIDEAGTDNDRYVFNMKWARFVQ